MTMTIPISIDLSASICIYLYLSVSIRIYPYLSVSICIYLYLSFYVSIYLSIFLLFFRSFFLSFRLSIYLSIHLSVHPCIHPSVHPSIHPFIHSSVHPFIHPFIHSSIHPFIHSSIHLYLSPCPAICPFIWLSMHTKLLWVNCQILPNQLSGTLESYAHAMNDPREKKNAWASESTTLTVLSELLTKSGAKTRPTFAIRLQAAWPVARICGGFKRDHVWKSM